MSRWLPVLSTLATLLVLVSAKKCPKYYSSPNQCRDGSRDSGSRMFSTCTDVGTSSKGRILCLTSGKVKKKCRCTCDFVKCGKYPDGSGRNGGGGGGGSSSSTKSGSSRGKAYKFEELRDIHVKTSSLDKVGALENDEILNLVEQEDLYIKEWLASELNIEEKAIKTVEIHKFNNDVEIIATKEATDKIVPFIEKEGLMPLLDGGDIIVQKVRVEEFDNKFTKTEVDMVDLSPVQDVTKEEEFIRDELIWDFRLDEGDIHAVTIDKPKNQIIVEKTAAVKHKLKRELQKRKTLELSNGQLVEIARVNSDHDYAQATELTMQLDRMYIKTQKQADAAAEYIREKLAEQGNVHPEDIDEVEVNIPKKQLIIIVEKRSAAALHHLGKTLPIVHFGKPREKELMTVVSTKERILPG